MKIRCIHITVMLVLALASGCTRTGGIHHPLHIAPAADECPEASWVLLTESVNGDTLYVDPVPIITEVHIFETAVQEEQPGPSVLIVLDEEGTALFGALTAARIGEKLAVVVDGELLTAPVVREAVTDGRAIITGAMTMEEAQAVADALAP